jgi:hypothetical protein
MAVYPNDATGLFTTASFSSMADRKPDKGFGSTKTYNTVIFETEAGYEKRRARNRRAKREYALTYTNVTGLERNAIESFYDARSGQTESFTFDLTHLSEPGSITARFDGNLEIRHILSTGDNLLQNFYTVSFKLKETFD